MFYTREQRNKERVVRRTTNSEARAKHRASLGIEPNDGTTADFMKWLKSDAGKHTIAGTRGPADQREWIDAGGRGMGDG